MEFRGTYTPAITPLNEDMSINWNGFDAILEHLIAAGVHGIVVGGTTGEYYVHTVEERVETLRRAKDVVAGRVALIGGTGGPDGAVDIGSIRKRNFSNPLACSRIVDRKSPAAAVNPFSIYVILPVILRSCRHCPAPAAMSCECFIRSAVARGGRSHIEMMLCR